MILNHAWTRCSRARLATRSAAGVFTYYNNHIRVRILFSWAGVTHVARAYQRRLDRFTHNTVRVGTCILYSGTAPRSVGPRLRLFVVCTSSALSSAPTTAAAPPSCTSPGAVAATSTFVGSATVCSGGAVQRHQHRQHVVGDVRAPRLPVLVGHAGAALLRPRASSSPNYGW